MLHEAEPRALGAVAAGRREELKVDENATEQVLSLDAIILTLRVGESAIRKEVMPIATDLDLETVPMSTDSNHVLTGAWMEHAVIVLDPLDAEAKLMHEAPELSLELKDDLVLRSLVAHVCLHCVKRFSPILRA